MAVFYRLVFFFKIKYDKILVKEQQEASGVLYLSAFDFPDGEQEASFALSVKQTCYTTYYPFGIFPQKELARLEFEPVTILYGGNGSGKTTVLNVIGEKLGLTRGALYNRSCFFPQYLALCRAEFRRPIPRDSAIITSDDVFDAMLDLRAVNQGIDQNRDDLMEQYFRDKKGDLRLLSLADYQRFRREVLAQRRSQSQYVRAQLAENQRECSNGERAFLIFTEQITQDRLYLLDEPENSLSPSRQVEFARFLADSARFYGCQFLISTHSPFFLAIREARIYDLDQNPVSVRPWTELENVRTYYQFFRDHQNEFEKG